MRFRLLISILALFILMGVVVGPLEGSVPGPREIRSMKGSFTYQGRLHSSGDPAEGAYDFTFSLFDRAENGRQIGGPDLHGEVEVAGGYFTVELNFGADPSIFNGLGRYLEISVKRTGSKEIPVVLGPRQKINNTPYANHARSAEEVRPLRYIADYVVRVDFDGGRKYFHHFNWLRSESEIIFYQDGGSQSVRKMPGQPEVGDLELRRFASRDDFLRSWVKDVWEGRRVDQDLTVYLLDRAGKAIDGWRLFRSWPSKVDYETDESLGTVVENVRIVAERIERIDVSNMLVDAWYPGPQPVVQLPIRVEIDGVPPLREYDELRGLGWEVQVIYFQSGEGGYVQKLVGAVDILDVKFGCAVANDDIHMYIWSWRKQVIEREWAGRSVSVMMMDRKEEPVLWMMLQDAWPAVLSTSYDAAKDRVEEELVIACDGLIAVE